MTRKVKRVTKGQKKKAAPEPVVVKRNPMFASTPRNFRVGGDIRPKRDLSRFVRWPKYIQLQRQKKILYQRLKVPPAIAQFSRTLDKNQATELFRLLKNYVPETKAEKKTRISGLAAAEASDKKVDTKTTAPCVLKFGLNHITYLIEQKKAKLVVIAHDVDPIELVVWLPALCRKYNVPYMIVKGKARLGKLVHLKTTTAVALTKVHREDEGKLATQVTVAKSQYNDNIEAQRPKWGGGIMGLKTQRMLEKRDKIVAEEAAKKAQY
jgi:large subunit ribosomal protein L7Ae